MWRMGTLSDDDNKAATSCAMHLISTLSELQNDSSGEIEFWGRISALQKATLAIVAAYAKLHGPSKVPTEALLRSYANTLSEAVTRQDIVHLEQ